MWFAVRGTWPPLDIIAIAVPLLGCAGLVLFGLVSARTGRLPPLVAGLSIFSVAAASVVLPRLPQEQPRPTQPVRIAAANVLGGNPQPERAAAVLAGRDVDVLVMIEAHNGVAAAVEASTTLPEKLDAGQFSVISRWPLTRLPPAAAAGEVPRLRLRIERPGAPFVLRVIHAPNPLYETTFEQQEALAAHIVETAEAEQLPAVVVGDLNLSDRAEGYRIITRSMRDAMRAGSWPGDTYRLHVWRALLLRIDHMFVPNGWCAADAGTFEVPGSDHRGIEATVGPCPAGG
jgi:endonuclease/exonuclease/phosphatase (EEP) superfamily protein YafD